MENKYYTPDISEFHVGFEYEVFINNEWKKYVLTEYIIDFWDFCGEKDEEYPFGNSANPIRVKYLDIEDIESCGFINCKKEYNDHNSNSDYDYFHNNNILRLRHYKNSHTVVLHNTHGITVGEYDTFFRGAIKNKSELLKLMKMLGINN